jgi:hypothetical protein
MPGDPATPAGSRVALAVLVGLVVLSPWPFGSVHMRTTQAIALVSLVTALGALLWDGWRGPLSLPPLRLLWPLLGLWALAVFQLVPLPPSLHHWLAPGSAVVWHPDVPAAAAVLGPGPRPVSLYPEATLRWLAFVTGVVALTLAATSALRERRLLLRASIAVVVGGVLVAVYGLVARLAFGDKLYGFLTVPTITPFGPFVSKNHFAGYVEMAACLAVGLAAGLSDEGRRGPERLGWLEGRRAGWVVLAVGAAGAIALSVPVSLSRGGVVSLAAGLVTFVLIRFSGRRGSPGSPRTLVLAAAGLLFVALGVASVLPQEARSRLSTLASTRTGGPDPFRLGVWRDSLRLAASSPLLGSGLGAFEDALPRFKTTAGEHRVEHAENDYIEVLAEGGGGALTLFAVAALSGLALGLRRQRAEPHRLARGLAAGALAGLVALLVHSAFDFNLRIPSNALLFALLFAMALQPEARVAEPRVEERARSSRMRTLAVPSLILSATAALGFFTSWAPRRLDAARLVRRPASAAALRTRALGGDVVEQLHRRPADAQTWIVLAWLRAPGSPAEAATLASWGVGLDPEHVALRRAAETVAGAQIQPRRP